MLKQKKLFFSILLFFVPLFGKRSIHRPQTNDTPQINVRWQSEDQKPYILKNEFLEDYPIFGTFNKDFFYKNILPDQDIEHRYASTQKTHGKKIKALIEKLISEIRQGKKEYSDFIVLRSRDFNRKQKSGLVILLCKECPFVVKVFIESPETFIQHNSKGIVPSLFFYMAGGINRHLLGFTRIKNLEVIRSKIQESAVWADRVTFPRKWFYLPKNSKWIEITGKNIGTGNTKKTIIPGIYCIVSDWIDAKRKSTVLNKTDRKTCMELCNYLYLSIDPHIDNFLIERTTGKIAIVDTEHFLTLVGIRKKKTFNGYLSWISHLTGSYIDTVLLATKEKRKQRRKSIPETKLSYD